MRGLLLAGALALACHPALGEEGGLELAARQDLATAIIACERSLWDVQLAPTTASTIALGRLPSCVDLMDRWLLVYAPAAPAEFGSAIAAVLDAVRRLEWLVERFNAGAGGSREQVRADIDAARPLLRHAREGMQE